jgi:hypothetical protein
VLVPQYPLKRGMLGSYFGAKYRPHYVTEFEWRYNYRSKPEIFGAAIPRC